MTESEPFWWEETGPPRPPPLTDLPKEVDAAIIGAGLTGLSAARTLARHGRSVLALDSGSPGVGASSRNGGMLGGGHRLSLDDMEARYGPDLGRRLLREAHLDSFSFVRKLIAEEDIACDFKETGRFRGFWHASEYESTARSLERLQSLIPLEAEMIPQARQRSEVASDLYRGGVAFPRHAGLNPAKWVAGLMAAALRAGASIQGDTAVTGVQRDGTEWRIRTPRGMVRAAQVLAATNGYTPAFLRALRRRIVPVPSFIAVTEPVGANRIGTLFPSGRMVVESRARHCYYRPSPCGTRIVFGGRAATFEVPQRFASAELRRLLTQVFPDLGPVSFTHSWRGRTGCSFDFLPNVGQIDGVWHALGYSGSGNAMAPWLGHKAALQMIGNPEGETAFSQTALPARWWKPGGAWFLPFADVTYRARDVIDNSRRNA